MLKKRLLSLMLVFTMLFSSIPVSAASDTSVRSTTDVNNSETVYLEADGQVSEPVELPQEEVQTEAPLESSFVESAEEEIPWRPITENYSYLLECIPLTVDQL